MIRPTGLIDPTIEVKPTKGQIDDLLEQISAARARGRAGAGDDADQADGRRSGRLSERDGHQGPLPALARSTPSSGSRSCATCGWASTTWWWASTCCARGWTCPKCRWWRSSTPTRKGSCARESALIQTIGRAARHVDGHVIMYADDMTGSMQARYRRDVPPARDPDRVQRGARHRARGIQKAIRDISNRVRAVAEQAAEYATDWRRSRRCRRTRSPGSISGS